MKSVFPPAIEENTDFKITHSCEYALLRGAGSIVYHKRCCERRVFRSQEVDANRLSSKRSHIEGPQRVAGCLVEIRERGERRQHRVARIPNLDLQTIEDGCGGCFGRRDLEPEAQRR